MKKKLLVGIVGILAITTLVGCAEGTVIYEEKEQKISTVEEIIADKLEVENPELDLQVNISEETE